MDWNVSLRNKIVNFHHTSAILGGVNTGGGGVWGVTPLPIIENLHFFGQNPSKILSNFRHYKIVIKKLLFNFLYFSKWFCPRKCCICCPTFHPPPWAHTTSCLRYAWAAVGAISFEYTLWNVHRAVAKMSGKILYTPQRKKLVTPLPPPLKQCWVKRIHPWEFLQVIWCVCCVYIFNKSILFLGGEGGVNQSV